MKVAIYSRVLKKQDIQTVQFLFDQLEEKGADIFVFHEYYEEINQQLQYNSKIECFSSYEDLKSIEPDYFITLGGDGTILDAITLVRDTNIPLIGINLGRLGFLAMVEKAKIDVVIEAMYQNSLVTDPRTLLYLESSIPIFGDKNFALNDFTILKRDTSSMVVIHAYVNGEFLNSYWADGIIVATPTGSTGYSLSCGGPIIFPRSGNFIITPVAPHNLNVRPTVLSDNAIISLEVEGRAKNFLCTLDSRYQTIDASFQLAVKKASFKANLVRLSDRNFLNMIREKLKWGIDSRN